MKTNLKTTSLLLLPTLFIQGAEAKQAQNREQPNILVIVCEDISPYLGCYGDKVAVSPNLDRFAEQSTRHTNMYTSVGVSSPSRYSLITGRFSSDDGANYMRVNSLIKSYEAVPPAGVKCYTEYMREAGYYCTNNDKGDYQFRAPKAAWDEFGVDAHWKHAPEDKPIFAIFNLFVTHESQIWLRDKMPLAVDPNDIEVPPYYPDTEGIRHGLAVMYSNITEMDKQFQSLLDELKSSERADNTIVIFYSDNGGPIPRGKREILDSGSHVPFMIQQLDGVGAGEVNEELNMFVDIPATILSLAGVEIPDNILGQAMYGDQKAATPRKYVFGATDRFDEQVEKRASIRDDRYLYVHNYIPDQPVYRPVEYRLQMPMMVEMAEMYEQGKLNETQRLWFEAPIKSEALYDCVEDPHQIHNLAYEKEYQSILKRMRRAYKKEWIDKYNSRWATWSEADYIAEREPEGEKQTVEAILAEVKDGVVTVLNDRSINSISYQIRKDGVAVEDGYKLYTEPIKLAKKESAAIIMERVGFKSTTCEIK